MYGVIDSGYDTHCCKDCASIATNWVNCIRESGGREKKTNTHDIQDHPHLFDRTCHRCHPGFAQGSHKSGPFKGAKANTGYVTHTTEGGNSVLTLSDDFKAPETPDPHWQIVDSSGNTYLLQKLSIKGGKMNRKITVPKYVPDIAKVQIWCAFAETNLGEAAFEQPVK
jgi:hypothetical protein